MKLSRSASSPSPSTASGSQRLAACLASRFVTCDASIVPMACGGVEAQALLLLPVFVAQVEGNLLTVRSYRGTYQLTVNFNMSLLPMFKEVSAHSLGPLALCFSESSAIILPS